MFAPLKLILDRIAIKGHVEFIDTQGVSHHFGDPAARRIRVKLADKRVERELALNPELALAEAYMDGRLALIEGSLYDLIAALLAGGGDKQLPPWTQGLHALRYLTKPISQFNPVGRARRNVAHHYDIDGAIYDLFLDRDRQYSCAYFRPGDDLEAAQLAKKRHVAAKLALRPGQRLLDIGSGWGGLALYLAEVGSVDVTGITLSHEQLSMSRERARLQGLSHKVRFEATDYREIEGRFDRIVSVGMFEHVGVMHYDTYFRAIADHLSEDGIAVVHSIGRSDVPTVTNPFIVKHIFPGGYIPALSEVLPAVERSGLIVTDVEVLRLHYAETLKAWRERFLANRETAARLRDERFCRMWEFYLAGAEAAFRYQGLMVFQLQLSKRIETLPITRGYMIEAEQRLAAREQALAEPRRMAGE